MKKLIVLLAAIMMVGVFTASAIADVSLYGSARFQTYSTDRDSAFRSNLAQNVRNEAIASIPGLAAWPAANETARLVNNHDDRDTTWGMDILSRFGATFKSGDIGGRFELDARSSGTTNRNYTDTSHVGGLRLRLLYGTWNFGSGTVLIGQDYPLTDLDVTSLQVTDAGLQNWGSLGLDVARNWQIKLNFGNLKLAFLAPAANRPGNNASGAGIYDPDPLMVALYGTPAAAFPAYAGGAANPFFVNGRWSAPMPYTSDTDTILPKIEVGYTLSLEPVTFDMVVGWQSYDVVGLNAARTAEIDTDVTSWVAALRAKSKFGPAYLNGIVTYAVNGNSYGNGWNVFAQPIWDGTTTKDTTTWAFALAGGYKISDMMNFEVGYGKMMSDIDLPGDFEDQGQAYYANLTFTLAPGVYFVPEFAVFDKEDITIDGIDVDEGKSTSIGAFWRIDFK